MRTFPLSVAFVMVAAGVAGCLDGPSSVTDAVDDATDALGAVLAPGEPLWYHPQTFPHPAYNFPTLSNPAVRADGGPVSEWLKPIPAGQLPARITGMEHVAQVEGTSRGTGMSLVGSIAVLPSTPTTFVDIRDPTAPVVVGETDGGTRGSDNIIYPNGTIVSVLATGGGVLRVVDITDPTNPVLISTMRPTVGTHKVDVVPGTPIVYNANSAGGGAGSGVAAWVDPRAYHPDLAQGITEIFDLSDPWNPVHVQDWANGYGCHRTYFYIEPAKDFYRAYCAGLQMTQIWDIEDPLNPRVVANVPVPHGVPGAPPTSVVPVTFSHFSIVNEDATVLIVGDETGGGGAPACDVYVETPAKTVSGPLGNVWFYDISDEQNPVLKGWLSPDVPLISHQATGSCTAHHGRLVPDPEGQRDLLAMGFYRAGVVLIDFTDPANPRIVDQFNPGSVWEAWYYNGYIFTGDTVRGLDVLKLR